MNQSNKLKLYIIALVEFFITAHCEVDDCVMLMVQFCDCEKKMLVYCYIGFRGSIDIVLDHLLLKRCLLCG